MQAAYIFTSYAIAWFAYTPYYYGLPYFLFLIPPIFDVFKFMILFITGGANQNPSNCASKDFNHIRLMEYFS